MLVVTDCLSGFKYGGGASVNHLDIAPHLAGVIQGVKNGIGQSVAFVVPLVIGYLTPYPGGLSREEFAMRARGGNGGAGLQHWINESSTFGDDAVVVTAEPPSGWVSEMQGEWRDVFLIATLMDAVGMTIYMIYGKGDRQWWDIAAAAT